MAKRSGTAGPHGIVLIDKPAGWTSHDVVAKARSISRQRRIGHTGTLDPMATGLLVLCLGQATRLVEYMTGHDKRYEGEITLGVRTDTDDAEGSVIARADVPALDDTALRRIEAAFTGALQQVPPAYSAVKVAGQRAYSVARRGGDVALAPRAVTVHRIALRPLAPGRLAVTVECGAGTYIRSLARDIGELLGCGAHVSALRRTRAGRFDVANAVTLDELAAAVAGSTLDDILVPPDEGVIELPAALVSAGSAAALRNGAVLDVMPLGVCDGPLRVYDAAGYFVATAALDVSGRLRPVKVMVREADD